MTAGASLDGPVTACVGTTVPRTLPLLSAAALCFGNSEGLGTLELVAWSTSLAACHLFRHEFVGTCEVEITRNMQRYG